LVGEVQDTEATLARRKTSNESIEVWIVNLLSNDHLIGLNLEGDVFVPRFI
jgi:hypothetical protein